MEVNEKLIGKLQRLGFPMHHRGTWYIHDAVLLWEPGIYLTKEIYPQVAHIHGVKWTAVERAVRATMDYVWDHSRGFTTDVAELLGIARIAVRPPAAELVAALGFWMMKNGG